MRRIAPWDHEGIIKYNLRDGGTAVSIFADTQTDRVERTKAVIEKIIREEFGGQTVNICEPGCSAGDISGPFSEEHYVWGCDVVPAAYEQTKSRYPMMFVDNVVAQDITPRPCDILVMCEFLEHIDDPIKFIRDWAPLAKTMVISHPVMQDAFDPEEGHVWSYYPQDYTNWFVHAQHEMLGVDRWDMGFYPMVLAYGRNLNAR